MTNSPGITSIAHPAPDRVRSAGTRKMTLIGFVGAIACTANGAGRTPGTTEAINPEACRIQVTGPREMRLRDGRAVHLESPSTASSALGVLIVANRALVWNGTGPFSRDYGEIIGVLRDQAGNVSPVAQPVQGRIAIFPRVGPASIGGWHVLFFLAGAGARITDGVLDSGEVWYGRFTGSDWAEVHRVGQVANARIQTRSSPTLIEQNGLVLFPYAYSNAFVSATATGHGVVMLRKQVADWQFDTVTTEAMVTYLDVALPPGSRNVEVGLVQGFFQDAIGWTRSTLFVRDYGDRWGSRRRVTFSATPVVEPRLVRTENEVVALWNEVGRLGPNGASIQMAGAPGEDGIPRITAADYVVAPGLTPLVVLGRDAADKGKYHPLLRSNRTWIAAQAIQVRNDGPETTIYGVSSKAAALLVSRISTEPSFVPFITNVYDLTLWCGDRR